MGTVTPGKGYIVGSYMPIQVFKVAPSSAEETANTMDVDLARWFRTIEGIQNILVLDSGNNVSTSDVDVTISGTTVTIADGSSYDLAATDTIYLTVYGVPVA